MCGAANDERQKSKPLRNHGADSRLGAAIFFNISPRDLSSRDMNVEISFSVVPMAHAICKVGEKCEYA